MNVNLTKLVNLDLNGKTITGNVTMTSDTTGTIDIKAGTITGDLTVDTKHATVNNSATVNGTVIITDVSNGTWNELVSVNKLVFNATNKTLNIANGVTALTINVSATVVTPRTVQAVVADGVTVTVKANESDETGIAIEGNGGELALDPEAPIPAEITINLPEGGFIVGKKAEFTVTTKANGFADTLVIGNSVFDNNKAIETLEYYEVKNDTWYTLSGDFGPQEGFPLADATSKFRISFNTAGNYEFTVNVREAANHDNILATKSASFVVNEVLPKIENAVLRRSGNILYTDFSINKDIDFSKDADVIIKYFVKKDGGEEVAIKNYAASGEPLIKDRTWDGYLATGAGTDGGVNYSKGTANVEGYVNLLPANTVVGTALNPNSSFLKDDGVVQFDLDLDTIIVKIIVKDSVGNMSSEIVREYSK